MGLKEKMMDKFFADMTVEDKQKMMNDMMPKMMMSMMGGKSGGMMSGMMDMMAGRRDTHRNSNFSEKSDIGGFSQHKENSGDADVMIDFQGGNMAMMPQMMIEMMPHCLELALPSIPKEQRKGFVKKIISILVETGSAGMSNEEKNDYIGEIVEQVTTTGAISI